MRKPAAILAADVVGYSRLIGANETATLLALRTLRDDVFGPVFAKCNGHVVKSMGDGWLIEFVSTAEAVNASMKVQDRLIGHAIITLRMGIHIGDVMRSDVLTADRGAYFGSTNWLNPMISCTDTPDGYSLRPIPRARGERLRLETRRMPPRARPMDPQVRQQPW